MKKSKFLIIMIAIMLIMSVFCLNVYATELEENVVEETGEDEALTDNYADIDVYEGDLYVFFSEDDYSSDNYVMDKYVDGNVFIFGRNVKITGQINGSLFVFANTLTIEEDSYIGCHIFAFADSITMSGFTYDMYAACKNFNMTTSGVVYRDLRLGADTAIIYGQIGRDVEAAGTIIDVYKDEETQGYIGGDFNYYSGQEIANIDKITINGEVKFTEQKEEEQDIASDYIYPGITSIVFTLVIYALIIFLAPKFTEKAKDYVSTRGLLALAVGLGFLVLVPIVAFLLLFTTIGVSVAGFMAGVYVLALLVATAIVSVVANEYIASKVSWLDNVWKKLLMIVAVSLVIYLIKLIPTIGGIIGLAIILIGLGIIVLYQFDKRKDGKDKATIVTK